MPGTWERARCGVVRPPRSSERSAVGPCQVALRFTGHVAQRHRGTPAWAWARATRLAERSAKQRAVPGTRERARRGVMRPPPSSGRSAVGLCQVALRFTRHLARRHRGTSAWAWGLARATCLAESSAEQRAVPGTRERARREVVRPPPSSERSAIGPCQVALRFTRHLARRHRGTSAWAWGLARATCLAESSAEQRAVPGTWERARREVVRPPRPSERSAVGPCQVALRFTGHVAQRHRGTSAWAWGLARATCLAESSAEQRAVSGTWERARCGVMRPPPPSERSAVGPCQVALRFTRHLAQRHRGTSAWAWARATCLAERSAKQRAVPGTRERARREVVRPPPSSERSAVGPCQVALRFIRHARCPRPAESPRRTAPPHGERAATSRSASDPRPRRASSCAPSPTISARSHALLPRRATRSTVPRASARGSRPRPRSPSRSQP